MNLGKSRIPNGYMFFFFIQLKNFPLKNSGISLLTKICFMLINRKLCWHILTAGRCWPACTALSKIWQEIGYF